MTKIIPLLVLTVFLSSCSTTKVIYVADSYARCEHSKSDNCLQIKENIEDDWVIVPNTIEGFDYKEGFTHKIKVEITKMKNATDNEPKLTYKLIKVIYQEKSQTKQENTTFDGQWKVSKLISMEKLAISPTLNFDAKANKVGGKAGCNTYGTTFYKSGNTITFDIPVATKMMCSNMNIEKAFFNCLQNISQYKLVDGNLTFYSKDGTEQMTCSKIEK